MKGYLLDTDILIDWLRGKEAPVTWLEDQVKAGSRVFISGITISEVFSGTSPEGRESREKLLTGFDYVPFSFSAAKLAGQLRFDHQRSGTSIALPDLIQAAIALTENLVVATANTVHFPNVETVNPRILGHRCGPM